MLKTDLEKRL